MNRTPKDKIQFIKEVLGTRYPEPKTELLFNTPFQLLIATILAAQATDRQVNIVTRELFQEAPDAKSLSHLEPEGVLQLVRSINYCNNKAKNIRAVSIILTEQYGGKVPETREELEKLPGVGRKTANVVLAAAFHQPVMPDSFVYLSDYFLPDASNLTPTTAYGEAENPLQQAWSDLLDEFYYQIEIFTSPVSVPKGVTLELWAGTRHRPEGEWIYAVDRKIELL